MKRHSTLVLATILAIISLLSAKTLADKLPDLYTVGWLNEFSPNELHPGDMLHLRWLVANNATVCIPENPFCYEVFGPAYGPWQEAAFLSKDLSLDSSDILLGMVTFNGVLPPGGAHEPETQFQVPPDCPLGEYRVLVHADYVPEQPSGQVEETNETNNRDDCPGKLRVISPLLLLCPNGGEALPIGSTYVINWVDYRSDGNCPGNYLLDYSSDSGENWTAVDSNAVFDSCSYDWLVPNVNSNQCLIRIVDADDTKISDISDTAFTVYECTMRSDLTGDCVVDFADLAILVADWLKCGNPFDPNCNQ